jgi:transcriptional regulator with XRE-family HTH domain
VDRWLDTPFNAYVGHDLSVIMSLMRRQEEDREEGPAVREDAQRQNWSRLGQLIKERRVDLGLTQAEVSSAGGPSPATLYLLEHGRREFYRPQILRRLERALNWRAGSVNKVLTGDQPKLHHENSIGPPVDEDRMSDPTGQDWAMSFRELPISRHVKLLILARLLEEIIAELNTDADHGLSVSQARGR